MTYTNTLLAQPLSVATSNVEQFQLDVIEGLSSTPKKLFSKYFYDQNGDQLFQQIMEMPTYYLTKCELEIFSNKTADLASAINFKDSPFDLIELGAGDAMKSSYLLNYLVNEQVDFTYRPIDISGHILSELQDKLSTEMPTLEIDCMQGEYFQMLAKATMVSQRRKVVLFLGGNIGNMELEEAYLFCDELRSHLRPGDMVLIGFDLKKNPHQILAAYNDKNGITAAFNLNLLARINTELGANLQLNNFSHYQNYDPVSGACRSYLVSLIDQQVNICGKQVTFTVNELIYMEVSQKFSREQIAELAAKSGFLNQQEISDSKNWFVDAVWMVK